VIQSFRHKGLLELFAEGKTARVRPDLQRRCLRRLEAIDEGSSPDFMRQPGFDFHKLHGKPVRYCVHVNGPWCITFGWVGLHAVEVDLEQYH
jgi:proteic killer suppression protein